ncbi:hypothetical protein R1flu_016339 [Riccia fluitans]|uniref:Uncharacterized protein n=1 Tax=Riccia fluitans TaxID=41844 RepID=A0ABD1YLJ4_9MARC
MEPQRQGSIFGRRSSFVKRQEISVEAASRPERDDPSGLHDIGVGTPMDSPIWKRANSTKRGQSQQLNGNNVQKTRQIEWMIHLKEVAQGLMTKLYRLRQILGSPDFSAVQLPDEFWKSGVLPDLPKICMHVVRKFPDHPAKLQLEKVDKAGLDYLHENAEGILAGLEPWLFVLVDLMIFREQALRVILDLSSTVVTLLPQQNPLILHLFMGLFTSLIRVNLLAEKVPRKMIVQIYNLTHTILKGGRDFEFYHKLVQFVDSYDYPLQGLHEDLNFVSPRIGEILDAVGPTIFLGVDYQRLRNEGYLSPFHPRYPDKLTNSAHPARAQDLAHIEAYREWVLFGYLVCPSELLRTNGIEIAMAILRETLVLTLFRDEVLLVHEEYQQYVLPKIAESKKLAKAGRTKGREADAEYNQAKQVEKNICEVQEISITTCDNVHREHRMFLKQELSRMVIFFTDQPTLLAPNIQMVFSAIAMARSEVVWFFSHVGVTVGKSKGNRVTPVDLDISDPSIGFLLDGMDRLINLIRKYTPAIRGFSLGYLSAAAQRIRLLLGSPGMVALDIDAELRHLFLSALDSLEKLPKLQSEKIVTSVIDLSEFRRNWLRTMMLVSSARSPINIRHLDKATLPGKESIVAEGNMAYMWSRKVDEIEQQLQQHGSLKLLYFYRQHVSAVFRHTMFGPEGRPQHCCAWLGLANAFPENAHPTLPDELSKFAKDAVSYAQALIEAVMGGLEGLINILDSEGGYGSLDNKLLPEQAAARLNQIGKVGGPVAKQVKAGADFPLPGTESEPKNKDSIKMLEAAVQRLVGLCSVLNEMEPVRILNHIYIPREYMRDYVMNNFRGRLSNVILVDGDLQRPTVVEARLQRHMSIIHLIEQHVSMDLTRGVREVLLAEAFAGKMRDLHPAEGEVGSGGDAVTTVSDWYIENIVKDVKFASVTFSPLDKCFKSAKQIGKITAESVAHLTELKAFVRIFGPYGTDKLDSGLREQLAMHLTGIDVTIRSNKEPLEALAAGMHIRSEREVVLKQLMELETLIKLSLQVGHILSFRALLAEATAQVLDENTPLLFSLFKDFAKHAPTSLPETPEVLKLKLLATRIGAAEDQDLRFVHSALVDVKGAGDSLWTLLPYFYVACMTSSMWNSSTFSIHTGGFSNNIHCLARCISAVFAASELVRVERNELLKRLIAQEQRSAGRRSQDNIPVPDVKGAEGLGAIDTNVKAMMKTFVQCSSAIMLEALSDSNRSPLVAKLVFMDQLCEFSLHLPRSTLEQHIPQSILRSIYQLYYENTTPTLVPVASNWRQVARSDSPSRGSRRDVSEFGNIGDTTTAAAELARATSRGSIFSGPIKFSSQRKVLDDPPLDGGPDSKSGKKPGRFSGPLDYNGARKVSFADNSSSASSSNPVPPLVAAQPPRRYISSRSGPVSYAYD